MGVIDGRFGATTISNFEEYRVKNNISEQQMPDLPLPAANYLSVGFVLALENVGMNMMFYLENDARETNIRPTELGGDDENYVDAVNLFFMHNHTGNFDKDDITKIFWAYSHGNENSIYNDNELYTHSSGVRVLKDRFQRRPNFWKLGDKNLLWLAIYGCDNIDLGNFANPYYNIFYGLHMILGSWDFMHIGGATISLGRNFAEDLLDGQSVSNAWLHGTLWYGVKIIHFPNFPIPIPWPIANHPAVLSAERRSTWNDGNVDWSNSTMRLDEYPSPHARMGPVDNIDHNDIFWMGVTWVEGIPDPRWLQ